MLSADELTIECGKSTRTIYEKNDKKRKKYSFQRNSGLRRRSVIREPRVSILFVLHRGEIFPEYNHQMVVKEKERENYFSLAGVERLRNAFFPCQSFYEDVTRAYLPSLLFIVQLAAV